MTLFFLCLAFLLGVLLGRRGHRNTVDEVSLVVSIVGLIGLGYGIANLLR